MPASAATPMMPTCTQAPGSSSAAQAAAAMRVMRGTSGHRLRPMPHSACATTATATTFSPDISP